MSSPESTDAVPQPVLAPLTPSAIFLVLSISAGGESQVRDALGDLAALQRAVGFRYPEGGLTCVAGIGSQAWDRLFSGPRPAGLHPLPEFVGAKHRSVSTPGDVLLHIRARQEFLCFELAAQVLARLRGAVTILDEVHGFKYWDERDLLGFVDGTENPTGVAARAAVAVAADEDPDFAGASYVVVQKYLHDLVAWNELPIEEQQRVVGRTKLDDIELADDVKPADSHVALTTITAEDGSERQIVRDNMPFGEFTGGRFGTYFIGYAADPWVIEQMLTNMFVGAPAGNHDRILDFSTAVTGSLFFVPTLTFLEQQPPEPTGTPTAGASLGIGSLKGNPPS
ncbi:Dyp-type peroxidase [Saccharopolyspora shandongensis]|uniref:Dyp-type peroxidase n=1 Tax=Saccharopolyspora shandongensis TaxID=418495 RepID=UPI0034361910